jgi:hypothetical protein
MPRRTHDENQAKPRGPNPYWNEGAPKGASFGEIPNQTPLRQLLPNILLYRMDIPAPNDGAIRQTLGNEKPRRTCAGALLYLRLFNSRWREFSRHQHPQPIVRAELATFTCTGGVPVFIAAAWRIALAIPATSIPTSACCLARES